ncbi:MAG: MFS transporter [Deinococcales bacterium]
MTTVNERQGATGSTGGGQGDRYKWIALSNTTLGVLMATINSSIVLISMPAIFRGIDINPLQPQNVSYLLWLLMGYMVITAVLVVSFGRVGDMYGRVRMYNLGFAVFTVGSILLSLVFWTGPSAALTLIGLRVVQGVGGALLMANSAAILTDAFPADQRGMALGINTVAGIAGSFIGLVIGGLLSVVDWHLVFLVSVPVGIAGTLWAYFRLREIGVAKRARIDWWGNLTFGVGLVAVLVGITYGIQPYGNSPTGWGNPFVIGMIVGGIAVLALFMFVETRVAQPMFRLGLFRIRAFSMGNFAGLLASIGRGGLMFMLIIWLQGIWLPLHGYTYESTPLWAAIYMLPMTVGFLIAGPVSGWLSDRFGARPFATGGMVAAAATFALMLMLPANFHYIWFALLLLANGLAMGLFSAPNTAGIMNSVPANERGVASGMRATFQNAGMNLSIGLFFSLMITGLASTLPTTLYRGLTAQQVPQQLARQIANLPPVGSLFAAFLGLNPMRSLLGPALQSIPPSNAAYVTGKVFFPHLISVPFMDGMHITFTFAMIMMIVAALASWFRGKRYVHDETAEAGAYPGAHPAVPALRVAGPEGSGAASASGRGEGAAVPPARPLVAISAASGSGESAIGEALAERLGVPFIDRAIPLELEGRVIEELEGRFGEHEGGPILRLLAELSASSTLFGIQGVVGNQAAMRTHDYVERVHRALTAVAQSTGAVIVGHGAAVALRDRPGVVRVRLTGPLDKRVETVMEAEGVDRATARRRVERTDAARRAYLRRLYDEDPDDARSYHLMLDVTRLSRDAAVDALLAAVQGVRAEVGVEVGVEV